MKCTRKYDKEQLVRVKFGKERTGHDKSTLMRKLVSFLSLNALLYSAAFGAENRASAGTKSTC